MTAADKFEKLCALLAGYGSAAVAFSGGADSALLLYAAYTVLREKAAAYTAQLMMVPTREADGAAAFCRQYGIRHTLLFPDVMQIPQVRGNQPGRCYFCKRMIFTELQRSAAKDGFSVVLEGSNADDCKDSRPGMRAIRELGIQTPLLESGLTKSEIRQLSEQYGLPTWDKPALACLASRLPYGTELTEEKLLQIDKAEQLLRTLGFRAVRVRMHGDDARLELPKEKFAALIPFAEQITQEMQKLGFRYISLDLQGYRTGSMEQTKGNGN